ncbi:MAG: calcium-binding protein [Gemmobacter sp.]|nr:calcium-binding protein [Gemmobacter sp.]
MTGEERHFLDRDALETLRSAETVQYENPGNFVPSGFYAHREDDLNLNSNPGGAEVVADTGNKDAAHIYGGKSSAHDHVTGGARGEQLMRGSDGDDVIDGNTGNDTIYGGKGADLIAGGIDNDVVKGDGGDDMLWGGDGNDTLDGGSGNDFVQGGRGDDVLSGGDGDDTIIGGEGDDTLTGGGGPDAINRFHFYEDSGQHVIEDFKVGLDLITLQDDIDPLTVELYENDAGNTVINHGDEGSIELKGVTLKVFQTAAADRLEAGDPIISITPDPEEEMLQEFRVEAGYYGDAPPPSLLVDGVDYGATAFDMADAGGYHYVSEEDGNDDRNEHGAHAGHGGGTDHGSDTDGSGGDHDHGEPVLPETSDDEEEAAPEDEEDKSEDGTCFIATAAYNDPWHPDVKFLRAFRDQWLVHRAWGRVFISVYWRVGPRLAGHVRRNPRLGRLAKRQIATIVRVLRKLWKA